MINGLQEIDFMSFSLVSSGEFADTFETEESVVETKAKSPRYYINSLFSLP